MKKLLSLMLSLAFAFSILSVVPATAAIASDGTVFRITGDAAQNVNNWESADASQDYGSFDWSKNGEMGKRDDDISAEAKIGTTAGELRWNVSNTNWQPSDREAYSYLVLSCQIFPNSQITNFYWTRNGSATISVPVNDTVIADAWVDGQWNTITTVYNYGDRSVDANKEAKTYVNGKLVYTHSTANSIEEDNDRLQMHVFGESGAAFGIDNVQYYQTIEEYIPTMPALTAVDGKYDAPAGADYITLSSDVAVSDLVAANGAAVRVYRDGTYVEQIADGSVLLTQNNKIVVEDSQGSMTVYNVGMPKKTATILKIDGENEQIGAWEPADPVTHGTLSDWNIAGTYGKESIDKAAAATIGSSNENRYQVTAWTRDAALDYLVMNYLILPNENSGITSLQWTTNQGYLMAKNGTEEAEALVINQWNSVTQVYQMSTRQSTVYINGVQTSAYTSNTEHFDNNATPQLRFGVFGTAGATYQIDNVYYYLTNAAPTVSELALASAFAESEKYLASRNTFGILPGKTVDASEVTTAMITDAKAVRVYTDVACNTVKTGILENGNVIVAENDNGLTYFTVTVNYQPKTYDILTFGEGQNDDSLNLPTDSLANMAWDSGIGGKADDDYSAMLTLGPGDDGMGAGFIYTDTGWTRTKAQPGSKYLVFETNIFPTRGVTHFRLGTNGHGSIVNASDGSDYDCNENLEDSRWNKVVSVLDIKTGYTQTYVNGTMVNDSLTAASNFGNAGFTQVRLIAWSPSYDGDDRPIVYFDDVRVYEAEVYPEITASTPLDGDGISGNFVIDNTGKTLTAPTGTAVSDITALAPDACTIRVIDPATCKTVESDAEVALRQLVAVENSAKNYAYYEVSRLLSDYGVVFNGEGYVAEFNEVREGTLNAAVYMPGANSEGVKVVIAQYSSDGMLMDVQVNTVTSVEAGLVNTATFEVKNAENSTVKAFVFDSMANLTPLSPATEAPYEADALKILCIGSSYGVDGTRYVQQMAKSAGKKVVIANLYHGGITIKEHLQNANENRADYTFYKNATGKWTYTKNKTLEYGIHNENWDIIVLQQGAADAADITAYEPLGDFIAYVERTKTNENCNFYWHMTWARHDGCPSLNGITSAEEYEKIVHIVQSEVVGKYGDFFTGVIPVGTAVQNARACGMEMHRDDISHLKLGYGRYLAGLVWTQMLTEVDIDAIDYIPTEGIDDFGDTATVNKLKEAAKAAIDNPYAVTQLNNN